MTKRKEHEEKEYYNIESVLKEKKYYDFIIGEHDKGKNYALLQRKQLELGR